MLACVMFERVTKWCSIYKHCGNSCSSLSEMHCSFNLKPLKVCERSLSTMLNDQLLAGWSPALPKPPLATRPKHVEFIAPMAVSSRPRKLENKNKLFHHQPPGPWFDGFLIANSLNHHLPEKNTYVCSLYIYILYVALSAACFWCWGKSN